MSRLFDILHLKFPAPQINSQKCSLEETAGEQKTGLPTRSKWQISLAQWQKVARREPERSAASAKRAVTPHRQVPGAQPLARLW